MSQVVLMSFAYLFIVYGFLFNYRIHCKMYQVLNYKSQLFDNNEDMKEKK